MRTDDLWFLVPARLGSKGIPRKALKRLSGQPLVVHTLEKLSSIAPRTRIIVSTESSEIAEVCRPYAVIHERPPELADDKITLDAVAVDVLRSAAMGRLPEIEPAEYLLTIQATCPFLRIDTIARCAAALRNGEASSIVTVAVDSHLRWRLDGDGQVHPLFEARKNRQELPSEYRETGGVTGTSIANILAKEMRLIDPIELVTVEAEEALDLDTPMDWAIAEYLSSAKRVIIRADASYQIGTGHIYRAIALAYELGEHRVTIVTRCDHEYRLGVDILAQHPFDVVAVPTEDDFLLLLKDEHPDLTILDVLSSGYDYMRTVIMYSVKVVTLEDFGPGAMLADVRINDLYHDAGPRCWTGVNYSIVHPCFESTTRRVEFARAVNKIVVTFGGSDPADLTQLALDALDGLSFDGHIDVVLGPGKQTRPVVGQSLPDVTIHAHVENMALLARDADLAITSAGRTVTELMILGIPTVVLCQHARETTHTHASMVNGVVNLGLGELVTQDQLARTIQYLIDHPDQRRLMHDRALAAVAQRSNRQVAQAIMGLFQTE